MDASVEVVCAVILAQGYGWWSQEVESVIDSEKTQIKADTCTFNITYPSAVGTPMLDSVLQQMSLRLLVFGKFC